GYRARLASEVRATMRPPRRTKPRRFPSLLPDFGERPGEKAPRLQRRLRWRTARLPTEGHVRSLPSTMTCCLLLRVESGSDGTCRGPDTRETSTHSRFRALRRSDSATISQVMPLPPDRRPSPFIQHHALSSRRVHPASVRQKSGRSTAATATSLGKTLWCHASSTQSETRWSFRSA